MRATAVGDPTARMASSNGSTTFFRGVLHIAHRGDPSSFKKVQVSHLRFMDFYYKAIRNKIEL